MSVLKVTIDGERMEYYKQRLFSSTKYGYFNQKVRKYARANGVQDGSRIEVHPKEKTGFGYRTLTKKTDEKVHVTYSDAIQDIRLCRMGLIRLFGEVPEVISFRVSTL